MKIFKGKLRRGITLSQTYFKVGKNIYAKTEWRNLTYNTASLAGFFLFSFLFYCGNTFGSYVCTTAANKEKKDETLNFDRTRFVNDV